jgi:plastocyanin
MRTFTVLLLILLVSTAIIAGCTVPSSPSSKPVITSSQPAVQSATMAPNGIVKNVIIRQRAFDPDIITISPGTTVVWTNEDTMSHRVAHLPELPSERELFYSEALFTGDTFRYTFRTAGRYSYGDPQIAGGRKSVVIVE